MTGFLDVALAVHPRAWRERYADEVRGTLLDVADATGGRVPLAETLPLGFRGLWLRARGSVTFWAGLVVIVLQVAAVTSLNWYYEDDGSLMSYVLQLNQGLAYSLPLIALASGWAGAASRRAKITGIRRRLRRLARDSWPLLAVTIFGAVVALIVLIIRFGVPWYYSAGALLPIAQIAMMLVAIAIGQLLGAVLPRVLVIFAAPAAALAVGMSLFGSNSVPWAFYPGLAYEVDARPVGTLCLVSAVFVAVAMLVVALRPVWLRTLPVLAMIALVVVGTVANSSADAIATPTLRAQSELVCSSDEPVICLWPEQEVAFGNALRAEMSQVYISASELGLPIDNPAARSVAQYAMTGIPFATDDDWKDLGNMGLGTVGVGPEDLRAFYAYSVTAGYWEKPTSADGEFNSLAFAISVLLGVPRDEAWPGIADPATGAPATFDASEIPDTAAARALVERWLSEGVDGVRKP